MQFNLPVEVASKFGTVVYGTSGRNEIKMLCPKCGHKALWVNTQKLAFICFYCEYSGRINSKNRSSSVRAIKTKNIENVPNSNVLPSRYKRVCTRDDWPRGWDYIFSRGINPGSVEFGTADEEYCLFPIRENGKVVYWQARSTFSLASLKTLNPKQNKGEYGREDVVFGIDTISSADVCILVEGVFDALTVGGVATLGAKFSNKQLEKIAERKPMFVLVCYDADAYDNSVLAQNALRKLLPGSPILAVRLNYAFGKDPNDIGMVKMFSIMNDAITASRHVFQLSSVSPSLAAKVCSEKLAKLLRSGVGVE